MASKSKWGGGRKRTAAGASLPSPRDPRMEHSLDDSGDWDEDGESLFLEYPGGLLCGAWNRCMNLSRWGTVGEENDIVSSESNNNRSNNNINNNNINLRTATVAASASAKAPTPAATVGASVARAAANEADIWQGIDLGHHEAGGIGNGDIGSLSPLTVSSPFSPSAKDLGRRRGTTEKISSDGMSAQPSPGSSRRLQSFFSGEREKHDGEVAITVTEPAGSRDCDSGGEKVAQRAPGDGGGSACLLWGGEAAGRGGAAGQGGGGPPAPPSRLGWGVPAPAPGVAGERGQKGGQGKSLRGRRSRRSLVSMSVESLREECDFEGRPTQQLDKQEDSPFAAAFSAPQAGEEKEEDAEEGEEHLVFTGLLEGLKGTTGQPPVLGDLASRALFSVSCGRRGVEREVGPLQVGANDRVYGALQYPSMKELWPDVYNTPAVRVVEADLLVEVRSRSRDVRYLRAELKVTYRRQGARAKLGASWRP